MRQLKSFKTFIRESSDECEATFQKMLFHAIHGKEPDTTDETEIWKHIERWFRQGSGGAEALNAFRFLLKCKGSYADLRPNTKKIYRGTVVSETEAVDALKKKAANGDPTTLKPERSIGNWVSYEKTYDPKKDYGWESWTSKFDVAKRFPQYSFVRGAPGVVPAVFEAKPDNLCVFNPIFSNKISSVVKNKPEFEIIRLTDAPIKVRVYVPSGEWLEKYRPQTTKPKSSWWKVWK